MRAIVVLGLLLATRSVRADADRDAIRAIVEAQVAATVDAAHGPAAFAATFADGDVVFLSSGGVATTRDEIAAAATRRWFHAQLFLDAARVEHVVIGRDGDVAWVAAEVRETFPGDDDACARRRGRGASPTIRRAGPRRSTTSRRSAARRRRP